MLEKPNPIEEKRELNEVEKITIDKAKCVISALEAVIPQTEQTFGEYNKYQSALSEEDRATITKKLLQLISKF